MRFSSLAKLLLAVCLFIPIVGCGGEGSSEPEMKEEDKAEAAKESAAYGDTGRFGPGGQDKPAPKEEGKKE